MPLFNDISLSFLYSGRVDAGDRGKPELSPIVWEHAVFWRDTSGGSEMPPQGGGLLCRVGSAKGLTQEPDIPTQAV